MMKGASGDLVSGPDVICPEALAPADGIVQCLTAVQPEWEDIRVQAIDPSGGAGSDGILIEVQVSATPEVSIVEPLETGVYYMIAHYISGVSTDAEDDPEVLVSSRSSSLDGVLQVDATPNSNEIFRLGLFVCG